MLGDGSDFTPDAACSAVAKIVGCHFGRVMPVVAHPAAALAGDAELARRLEGAPPAEGLSGPVAAARLAWGLLLAQSGPETAQGDRCGLKSGCCGRIPQQFGMPWSRLGTSSVVVHSGRMPWLLAPVCKRHVAQFPTDADSITQALLGSVMLSAARLCGEFALVCFETWPTLSHQIKENLLHR
jgi:hypothetical protein